MQQIVSVTIAHRLYAEWDFIEDVAMGIAKYEESNGEIYEPFLGHGGKFENNPRASDLYKIHIAHIGGLLSDNWQSPRGYNRTSDHFVVYCRHWFLRERFHILSIITPNAHKRIDSLISHLIDQAEAFNAMSRSQIDQLPAYTPLQK